MRSEIPSLSRIDWQYFVTLTLATGKESVSDEWFVKHWFSLAREVAGWFRVHFLSVKWCLRLEKGEVTRRRHCHALMGGFPLNTINQHTCFAIKNQAEKIGWGMARCYVFNGALDGVGYLLKSLADAEWKHTAGASMYEFSKFRPDQVMISMSVIREIDHRSLRGDTLRRKQEETAA